MLQRFLNLGNPIVVWLLRSQWHGAASRDTLLINYTGRKSGKTYTVPVNYVRQGNTLIVISRPERTWWKNLRGGAPVTVRVQGEDLKGQAEIVSPDDPAVLPALQAYYRRFAPRFSPEQVVERTRDRVIIRIRLE